MYIGLGSNLGDRKANLSAALRWLAKAPQIALDGCTDFMETAPWGVTDQPPFLNAVCRIHTSLSPHELLIAIKIAEVTLGRDPNGRRWGPRVIDLDILLYGDEIIDTPELTVPHPRLVERDFILKHLVTLAGDIVHPLLKRPLSAWFI